MACCVFELVERLVNYFVYTGPCLLRETENISIIAEVKLAKITLRPSSAQCC